ncbi:hypothetical protein GIB67_017546, partial [Kingdonia uniflora]
FYIVKQYKPLLLPNQKFSFYRWDKNVARLFALLFSVLIKFIYVLLYFRRFRLAIVLIGLGILLLVCMKISRDIQLKRKKRRRLQLPLSM